MSLSVKEISLEEITDLPETIYKYRTWTDKWHKTILTKQVVFLAQPTSFEDEKDCRSLRRYDLLTPKDIWEKYYNLGKLQYSNYDELDLRKYATEWFRKSRLFDMNYIKQEDEKTLKEFDKRFGVLSLTANPRNHEMWMKYSAQHKGFCVGFHPLILFKHLGGGGKVSYVDKLPDIMPLDNSDEEFMKQVLFKERVWEFEQEYRTHYFWNAPATLEQRARLLPAECYKEIIFGGLMPEKHRTKIRNICIKKGLILNFYEEVYNPYNQSITLKKLV